LQASIDDGIVDGFEIGNLFWQQALLIWLGAFDCGFDLDQQLDHLGSPGLLVLISNEDQISQMMRITETIDDVVILEV